MEVVIMEVAIMEVAIMGAADMGSALEVTGGAPSGLLLSVVMALTRVVLVTLHVGILVRCRLSFGVLGCALRAVLV